MSAVITWEQARAGKDSRGWKLGGSSAGIVLGLSPFCDRFSLWARMRDGLNEPEDRELDDEEGSEILEAGNIFEDGILDWYRKRTSRLVIPPAYVASWMLHPEQSTEFASPTFLKAKEIAQLIAPNAELYYGPDADDKVIFRSKRNPLKTGTLDAFCFDENKGFGIIDAKHLALRKQSKWKNAGVPAYYAAQNHHYCEFVPDDWSWVGWAVCFGGQHLGVFDLDRSREFEATIDSELAAFAIALDQESPPTQFISEKSLETLKQMFKKVEIGEEREWPLSEILYDPDGVPISADQFDKNWQALNLQLRDLGNRKRHLESLLRYVMGDAQRLVLGSGAYYDRTLVNKRATQVKASTYVKITRHYEAPIDEPSPEIAQQSLELERIMGGGDPREGEPSILDLYDTVPNADF
jgi:predicted phage-related endonuclease